MTVRAILIFVLTTLPVSAAASPWPADIFDGAAPQVLTEVKAHQDLVQEAETHLYECPSDNTHDACLQEQYNFVLDYIYAMYNDHDSQDNVAFLLAGDGHHPIDAGEAAFEPGITTDPIRGCAWRIAIIAMASGGPENDDLEKYKMDCLHLSTQEQSSANAIAYAQIISVIVTNLARHDRPFDIFTGN